MSRVEPTRGSLAGRCRCQLSGDNEPPGCRIDEQRWALADMRPPVACSHLVADQRCRAFRHPGMRSSASARHISATPSWLESEYSWIKPSTPLRRAFCAQPRDQLPRRSLRLACSLSSGRVAIQAAAADTPVLISPIGIRDRSTQRLRVQQVRKKGRKRALGTGSGLRRDWTDMRASESGNCLRVLIPAALLRSAENLLRHVRDDVADRDAVFSLGPLHDVLPQPVRALFRQGEMTIRSGRKSRTASSIACSGR